MFNLVGTAFVLGKTGRGGGVGAGDQWVKPGDGKWEIDTVNHSLSILA